MVPEEEQEVGAVAPINDVQHSLPGLPIDLAGEDNVLDRVQDDGPVRLGGGLTVETRTCFIKE